jgi:hypothetical protein
MDRFRSTGLPPLTDSRSEARYSANVAQNFPNEWKRRRFYEKKNRCEHIP